MNKILKQLLIDDRKYSFYGKRLDKKPFSTLLMKNIIISYFLNI